MFIGNDSLKVIIQEIILYIKKKKKETRILKLVSLVKSDETISINTCLRGGKKGRRTNLFLPLFPSCNCYYTTIYWDIKKDVSLLEKVLLNLIEQIAIFYSIFFLSSHTHIYIYTVIYIEEKIDRNPCKFLNIFKKKLR